MELKFWIIFIAINFTAILAKNGTTTQSKRVRIHKPRLLHLERNKILCCNDTFFPNALPEDRCCNGTVHNALKSMCCNGNVFRFSQGISPYGLYCCGSQVYNTNIQICCDGVVSIKLSPSTTCCKDMPYERNHGYCCDGKITPFREKNPACCAGNVYSRLNYTCCNNKLSPILPGTYYWAWHCCGNQSYNMETSLCCNETVIKKTSPYMKCCGKKGEVYDGESELCCNGVVFRGMARKNGFRCCGIQSYNVQTHICCPSTNTILEKPKLDGKSTALFCCAGKELYNLHTHKCCSGVVLPGNGSTLCCGKNTFDFTKQTCCGGTILEKPNMECCGSKHWNSGEKACCDNTFTNMNEFEKYTCKSECYMQPKNVVKIGTS